MIPQALFAIVVLAPPVDRPSVIRQTIARPEPLSRKSHHDASAGLKQFMPGEYLAFEVESGDRHKCIGCYSRF